MYLSMGRDLQAQLEALGSGPQAGTPEVRERAARILAGFEKFLDGVAKRDPKISSQIWVATTYLTLGSGTGTGAVVPKSKTEQYLDRAADAYARMLARKDDPQAPAKDRDDVARFEPSIRLKMASIFKDLGKWDAAQRELDWILADPKRRNLLDIQIQAAELLEAAGRGAAAAGDTAKADALLREAAAGRTSATTAIWGWGGIANKLSRQAFASADERALKARAQFFDARLRVAETLLQRARLGGQGADRDKRLETAKTAISMTRKLYPDLGGEAFQKRFEKVLKEVQKEQGAATPGGFKQLDEEAAAARPVAAGSAP
jgi:tetratricopeptide (TPR) repeat protein